MLSHSTRAALPLYDEISLSTVQRQENRRILQSIRKNGLVPLSKIPPKDAIPNSVLHTQMVAGNICVNEVNLTGSPDQTEIELALKTATDEEYMGIIGISLERQSPFQQFNHPSLLKNEMTARLLNSVVFVLEPPTRHTRHAAPHQGEKTVLSTYEYAWVSHDGHSHARDHSITENIKLPYTNKVTEIKTTHSFTLEEIFMILVPEPLYQEVTECFAGTNIKITSVPMGAMTIKKVPKLLNNTQGENLLNPITTQAPLYYQKLLEVYKDIGFRRFSLHAVRLHTPFDFIPRPVLDISRHQGLINLANAHIVKQTGNNGWLVVHKSVGLSRKNTEAIAAKSLNPHYSQQLTDANKLKSEIHVRIAQLKGDTQMVMVYGTLRNVQLQGLQALGATVIRTDMNYYAINFASHAAKDVAKIVTKFDVKNYSATQIQTFWRGYQARKIVAPVKKAKQEFEAAKEAMHAAVARLSGR